MLSWIKKFFSKGHERSVKAKKQILFSFLLKGISIAIGFVMLPLLLAYLDNERYGIWLTISSMVCCVSFMDMGLGHGLRNRFGEAISASQHDGQNVYKHCIFRVGPLMVLLLLAFFLINPFINWQSILNSCVVFSNELASVVEVVFFFFVMRFQLGLIGMILLADQKPAINNIFGPAGNLLSFLAL